VLAVYKTAAGLRVKKIHYSIKIFPYNNDVVRKVYTSAQTAYYSITIGFGTPKKGKIVHLNTTSIHPHNETCTQTQVWCFLTCGNNMYKDSQFSLISTNYSNQ